MATNPEIHRTVRAINISLDETIAFYETYVPTAHDGTLIEQMNKSGFHPAFNVISDALHREVILGLCRIWDTRSDTANLNQLANEFRNPSVLADLSGAGCAVNSGALSKWLAEIDVGSKSGELLALKRARHRALAHTATPNEPYKGTARVAEYGDERKLLELTIPLVEEASNFVGYSYRSPFADRRQARLSYAKKFWDCVAGSV